MGAGVKLAPHYSTTTVPCSMFIPHAKAMSPALAGVNSITTGSFNGSGRPETKTLALSPDEETARCHDDVARLNA